MKGPMELPFQGPEVPHVLLDILRGCNLRCRACYNAGPDHMKSVEEVLADFEIARRHRRLDCVTVLGGEPLLHPDLLEIIRRLCAQKVRVALFTNGLGLGPRRAQELKSAGAELVVLHIEAQQGRVDLADESPEALRELREDKLAILAEAGLEAGLSITAMPGCEREVLEALETAITSPHLSFFLVTLALDLGPLPTMEGDIFQGIRARGAFELDTGRSGRLALVRKILDDRLGEPFALHPSIDGDPRWFAHLVATVHEGAAVTDLRPLQPTWMEPLLNGLMCRIRGRHFFYQPQRRRLQFLHLLLNGLAGGGLGRSLATIWKALRPGGKLRVKRFLLQVPASLKADGQLSYCRDCPDAVVRNGHLVPVCIGDRIELR